MSFQVGLAPCRCAGGLLDSFRPRARPVPGDTRSKGRPVRLDFIFDETDPERTDEWFKANQPKGSANRRSLRWTHAPDGKIRGLFFQLAPQDSSLKMDLRINGVHVPGKV